MIRLDCTGKDYECQIFGSGLVEDSFPFRGIVEIENGVARITTSENEVILVGGNFKIAPEKKD